MPTIKILSADRFKDRAQKTLGATAPATVPPPVAAHKEKSPKLRVRSSRPPNLQDNYYRHRKVRSCPCWSIFDQGIERRRKRLKN
jgi:hypothetical protein